MTTRSFLSGASAATAVIALTAVCFGLVPLFARQLQILGVDSSAIALYRYVFSAAVMLPFLPLARAKRREALLLVGAGLSMGLGWIGYLEALQVVPIAAASVIYMTYPLFTVLFAWVMISQRPTRRAMISGFVVLAAAALLFDPRALSTEGLTALLWSLPAPISFGFVIVVLSAMVPGLNPLERMACGMTGAVVGLAPLALSVGPEVVLLPAGVDQWLLIAGMGAVTALVPQLLYTLACPRVGPSRSAAAGSFELPTMFAVGWFAFGEVISSREVISASLVLIAIVLAPTVRPVSRKRTNGRRSPPLSQAPLSLTIFVHQFWRWALGSSARKSHQRTLSSNKTSVSRILVPSGSFGSYPSSGAMSRSAGNVSRSGHTGRRTLGE